MSSNRTRLLGVIGVVGLGLFASACATPADTSAKAPLAITPTEQFPLETVTEPQGILLAPHDNGLSPAQTAELAKLARDWREGGRGLVLVEAPARGGPGAATTAYAARDALRASGVPGEAIDVIGYDDTAARAPIRVSFLKVGGKVNTCGREWSDLSKTKSNQPTSNFGCAVNSNLAAMMVNPNDIESYSPILPADAGRRQVVIDKYRAGQVTSSAVDREATGVVSNAVN